MLPHTPVKKYQLYATPGIDGAGAGAGGFARMSADARFRRESGGPWNQLPGQLCSSTNSRVVRGPGLRGVIKGQVRQGAGEKLASAQQLSGRVHVGTWAGGSKSLNLRISQEQEIGRRCAVVGFPPRTPSVTPVLPGPGSDIRMKKGWKVQRGVCVPGGTKSLSTSTRTGVRRSAVFGSAHTQQTPLKLHVEK